MSELITPDLVRLDVGLGSDKQDVIRALAAVVAESGRTGNAEGLATDVLALEATSATGMPGGIAISASAYEQVRDKIEYRFVDCGLHAVKNIARPVRAYRLTIGPKFVASSKGSPITTPPRRSDSRARNASLMPRCTNSV